MITFFYFKFFPLFFEFPDTNNLIFINFNEIFAKRHKQKCHFSNFWTTLFVPWLLQYLFFKMNEFFAFFGTFLCFLQNMSYFQSRKSSWRETTQGQLSFFQALKMKCSLVICRIAIKQEMSLFQTFGLPLFVSHRVFMNRTGF